MIKIKCISECPEKSSYLPLKVTEMGNIIELQYMSRRNCKISIRMLEGGEQYVDLSSGEIKDVVHHTTRLDQIKNIYRTFKTVRGIINSNVVDVSRVRWITLTYAENMIDTKQLYDDFAKFNKRFQYYIKKLGYNKAEYIVMCEPQGRGAWHMHLLYIFDTVAPFLDNNTEFNPLWGHGFTKIKSLKNVDNVGAYLTAYLGDMEYDDLLKNDGAVCREILEKFNTDSIRLGTSIKEIEVLNDDGEKVSKKFIKGARLNLYPVNFNMFRCSRGVLRPVEYFDSQENAEKKVSVGTLTYEKTVLLQDLDNDFESIINTRQYNIKRGKNQVYNNT